MNKKYIALIVIIPVLVYFGFTSQPSDYRPEIARMAEDIGDIHGVVGVTCEKGWFTETTCKATLADGAVIDWPIETVP